MDFFELIINFIISLSAAYGIWTFLEGRFCQFRKPEEEREKNCVGAYCFSRENCPYCIDN